jgi:hypothetical protein
MNFEDIFIIGCFMCTYLILLECSHNISPAHYTELLMMMMIIIIIISSLLLLLLLLLLILFIFTEYVLEMVDNILRAEEVRELIDIYNTYTTWLEELHLQEYIDKMYKFQERYVYI